MSVLREFSSGSRFIFWALAPFLILFAVIMPLTTESWDAVQIVLVVFMDAAALLLVLGLYDPRRFNWALRAVTGIVFLAYVAYLVYEFGFSDDPARVFESQAKASPRNALLGFVIIGLPCLGYTILGKPLERPEKTEGDESMDGTDGMDDMEERESWR